MQIKSNISHNLIKKIVRDVLKNRSNIDRITSCRGGFFNSSYKIIMKNGEKYILRVSPERSKALLGHEKYLLRREASVLNKLKKIALPVPSVIFKGFNNKIIDRDFLITGFIEGVNWYYWQKKLSNYQNHQIFNDLGSIAGKIHSIENNKGTFGFPSHYGHYSKWSLFIIELMSLIKNDMIKYSPKILKDHLFPDVIAKRLEDVLDDISLPCLVHGDLWPRNVLLTNKGELRISGVLDMERSLWGDPDFEWVFHCWKMPLSFWKGYGEKNLSSRALMRRMLYKGYYELVASLEEIFHFGRKKNSLFLFHKAEDTFKKLHRVLSKDKQLKKSLK